MTESFKKCFEKTFEELAAIKSNLYRAMEINKANEIERKTDTNQQPKGENNGKSK